MKRVRHWQTALYLAIVVLASVTASAHSLGVSQSEFAVSPDGTVDATIEFAATEALTNVVLDANHDGTVTDAEVIAAAPDLAALTTRQIEVDGDGRVCPGELRDARVTDGDGLTLHAVYRCERGIEEVRVTLFFLSELKGHKHAARITAGDKSAQALLGPTSRFVSLELPQVEKKKPAIVGWRRTAVVVLSVVFAVFMSALFAWRFRAMRKAKK